MKFNETYREMLIYYPVHQLQIKNIFSIYQCALSKYIYDKEDIIV